MRKILPILLFLALCGCRSTNGDPERVAERFLEAYYAQDLEKAAAFADEATRSNLEVMLEKWREEGITPAQMQADAQPVIIEVEGIIANDGERAVCTYKVLTSPDDANALMESLLLINTGRGWKAVF